MSRAKKIAYQGEPGANSHIACHQAHADYQAVPCPTFEDAFAAVETGEAALGRFVALPPSTLERREKLEQLRALEAGMRIDAAIVGGVPLGVDTPEDLARARIMLEGACGMQQCRQ